MAIKLKSSGKTKASIKPKSAVKPNKKISSKQNDLSQLSEDIISNVGVGIYIVQHGKFIFASPLYQRLTGYSATEIIGHNSLDHVHPDDKAMVRTKAIKSLKGKSHSYEYRFIRKNGEEMWILEMVTSITYKGKRAALGSFMDITEHRLAEEALRQSEEKYRTIVESIEDGYFETDLAGNNTLVNDVSCRHLKYPKEELIGINNRQFQDKTNAKKTYQAFHEIYKTGTPLKALDMEVIRKDGTKGVSELSVSLIRNSQGQPIGFRGISRDVSERKLLEEKIRQSEERYRTIIEQMEDGYFEIDLTGKFTYVNEAECRNLGYTHEELIGMTSRQYADEKNRKTLNNLFIEVYKTGIPVKAYDLELVKKDGTKSYDEISVSLIRNSKGESIGFRGIARNVTERKLMEENIRQSEERYRTIIEEMEEWYFETDLAGKFLYFNDALVRASGYPQKELTGLNFRALIKQEQAEEIYKIFHQVYEIGEPIKNFPQEFARPNGSITFAEVSVFPKRDHRGKIFGFRGVGHDITERKRVEQELSYMATHDPLTGLPNRMLFMDRLKMALAHAKRNKQKLAVMMLDLDHFKNINDTLGHLVGDRLLKEIGLRLTGLLRQNDTISRLGGDEFIILLSEIVRMEDSVEVAEKILKAIQQPFICDSHQLITSTSIGIAIYPDDCQDMDSLMKNADMAMYSVKAHGRNSYQFFTKTNL